MPRGCLTWNRKNIFIDFPRYEIGEDWRLKYPIDQNLENPLATLQRNRTRISLINIQINLSMQIYTFYNRKMYIFDKYRLNENVWYKFYYCNIILHNTFLFINIPLINPSAAKGTYSVHEQSWQMRSKYIIINRLSNIVSVI